MESSRIARQGPEPEDERVPVRRKGSQTQSRRPRDLGSRHGSDAVTSRGTPGGTGSGRCEEGSQVFPWQRLGSSLRPGAHPRLPFQAPPQGRTRRRQTLRAAWVPGNERPLLMGGGLASRSACRVQARRQEAALSARPTPGRTPSSFLPQASWAAVPMKPLAEVTEHLRG